MKHFEPVWLVILGGVSAALHVGKLPPALPALREALGIGLMQAGFLLSLVQLAGMALGLVVGLAADGMGLKRSMLAGLLLLGVASTLGGFSQDAASLLLVRGIEGLGFLLASLPAPSLIRRLVPPEQLKGRLGLWGAYMPLGSALALLVGPLILLVAGWRGLWWFMGALSFVVAAWIWRSVPPDALPDPMKKHEGWSWRLRQTLQSSGPWLVALTFAMYSSQWLAVIGFLPSIYAQAGVAVGANAVLTALAAAVNMIGNVASGRLLQRGFAPQHLLFTGFTAMGLGALLAFAPATDLGPGLRYGAVLVFSMVGGVIPGTLFSLAVQLAPGEHAVSTTVGWTQQCSAAGQFFGPPFVAWVAVVAGGWSWTWAVTGACSIIGVVLAGRLAAVSRRSK